MKDKIKAFFIKSRTKRILDGLQNIGIGGVIIGLFQELSRPDNKSGLIALMGLVFWMISILFEGERDAD